MKLWLATIELRAGQVGINSIWRSCNKNDQKHEKTRTQHHVFPYLTSYLFHLSHSWCTTHFMSNAVYCRNSYVHRWFTTFAALQYTKSKILQPCISTSARLVETKEQHAHTKRKQTKKCLKIRAFISGKSQANIKLPSRGSRNPTY